MEQKTLRVLMIEDSANDAELTLDALRQGGFAVDCLRVETAETMRDALNGEQHGANRDLVLSDYNLPAFSAEEALSVLQASRLEIPFIIVSGCIGEEAAVALMKAGAQDFVMKASTARLVPAVQRGLLEAQTRKQFNLAQAALQKSETRFRAIASNLPGAVFQFLRQEDGAVLFPYVSDGSQALLGSNPQTLRDNPESFTGLIFAEDRASFQASMAVSARDLSTWNWEGRIGVGRDKDIKWINLRASPRVTSRGAILWDGIMANITQGKLAEIEVMRSREQLAELSSHLQKVKERERTRIAREIHDELGGTLTAVKIDLLWLCNRLPAGRADLQGKVNSIDRLVDRAIETGARISRDLRPGILDLGIVTAIEWQAREFQSHTGINCEIASGNEEIAMDPDLSVAVFRVFQETLTNISKHANASMVRVSFGESGGWLELEVRDNGRGITKDDMLKSKSFGIRGMLERIRDLGGKIEISGAPGQGTTFGVRLPRTETFRQAVEQQPALF